MTKSIPINKNDQGQAEEEAEYQRHALVADYKDYVFYSRVVEGMRRVQDHTRDIALRYENQAVIDHIVRTRHCQMPPPPTLSSSPTSVRNFGDDSSKGSSKHGIRRVRSRPDLILSEALEICQTRFEDQDLIFDMEL